MNNLFLFNLIKFEKFTGIISTNITISRYRYK